MNRPRGRPSKFDPNSMSLELTDQMLKDLDIDNKDFPDFMRCVTILAMQMEGMQFQDACDEVGVNRRTTYDNRWLDLMAKARRFHARPLLAQQAITANYVFREWDNIVRSLVQVAKFGARDHEKVQAAELLYQIYIQPIQTAPQDDSKEMEYLRKPKNFNTMTPIQVNEGGTVIINNGTPDTDTPDNAGNLGTVAITAH